MAIISYDSQRPAQGACSQQTNAQAVSTKRKDLLTMLKTSISITVLAFAMAGCTSFPTVDRDSEAGRKLLRIEAPSDGAALYVYRDSGSQYGIVEMLLQIDGKNVSIAPSCFRRIELKPGTYHLEADHPDVFGTEHEIDLTLKDGDVRVYEFKPIWRFMVPGESKLIPSDKERLQQVIHQQQLCAQEPVKL